MARYFIIGWWTVKRQFLMFIFVSFSPIFFFFLFFLFPFCLLVFTCRHRRYSQIERPFVIVDKRWIWTSRRRTDTTLKSHLQWNKPASCSIASARRTWREEEKCFILFEFNRYDDTTFTLQLFSTSFSLHFVYTFHKKEGHTLRSSGIIDEMW